MGSSGTDQEGGGMGLSSDPVATTPLTWPQPLSHTLPQEGRASLCPPLPLPGEQVEWLLLPGQPSGTFQAIAFMAQALLGWGVFRICNSHSSLVIVFCLAVSHYFGHMTYRLPLVFSLRTVAFWQMKVKEQEELILTTVCLSQP